MKTLNDIAGKTGLGFRKDFAEDFLNAGILAPAFVEFAPENWLSMGGYWRKILNCVTEKYPVVCHGLSLSLGSPEELDWDFLKQLKLFFKQHNVLLYSEHLSYSKCDNAHLYDLLPIPFRMDAVKHISQRIKEVQDFLEMKIAIENVSYYTPVAAQMPEHEFISEIVQRADCNLLLDVNNVYVNAFNHQYNAENFIEQLPLDRVAYIHMAGHLQVEEDLIIDTHGEAIIDPVYQLFDFTIQKIKPVPVLLERDFNIPELSELQNELNQLQGICKKHWEPIYVRH
jgi:uncharacterized protein (UPF0276 family)